MATDGITVSTLRRGRRLLDQHGLEDWSITIDKRPSSRNGVCRYQRKQIGISLCFLVATVDYDPESFESDLDDLLLHEIAHALCPQAAHRKAWKMKYAELLYRHFEDSPYRAERYLRRQRFTRDFYERGRFQKLAEDAEKRRKKKLDRFLARHQPGGR